MVESLLKEYPNVLVLRVRMPIVADLVYPRNFITKIIRYDKASPAAECSVWQAETQVRQTAASITSQDTALCLCSSRPLPLLLSTANHAADC